jgi:hypothetical protein
MPILHRNALVAATALLVASARDGLAQDPLAGVRAVEVVIDLPENAAKLSLTESDVRTKVELKLRTAGLRVGPASEQLPWFYVQVGLDLRTGSNICVFGVRLALYEYAVLPRTKTLVKGQLWTAGAFGSVGNNQARETLLGQLDEGVDRFLNSWLAANPK